MVKAKSSAAAGAAKSITKKPARRTAAVRPVRIPKPASSPAAPKPKPKPKKAPVIRESTPHAAAAPKISVKLARGRFTMPEADFDRISLLKNRARELGRPAKKNELLRAGLRALVMLSDESLMIALDQLEATKPGKPAKQAKAPKAPKAPKPPKPAKTAKAKPAG
ncbi:MAG: hypothetical protein AB7E72_20640 [Lysobacterales bacterium]